MNSSTLENIQTHLIELRARLIKATLPLFLVFLSLVYWAPDIFKFFIAPFKAVLMGNNQLAFHDVMGSFVIPIKLTFLLSLLLVLPWVLYQIWAFIAPALYVHEKRLIIPIVGSSYMLFLIGIGFAYYVVCPMIFYFISHYNEKVGQPMFTDIGAYVDFLLNTFLSFGVIFEIPVIIFILTRMGFIHVDQLKKSRPYAIVAAFVLAAILTPPDPFSQIAMAVPICLLYELGIYVAVQKPKMND